MKFQIRIHLEGGGEVMIHFPELPLIKTRLGVDKILSMVIQIHLAQVMLLEELKEMLEGKQMMYLNRKAEFKIRL